MAVSTFLTIEELFESMQRDREQANEHIQDWQWKVKPGDNFIRTDSIVPIYGTVLEIPEEDANLYEQEHMKGYCLTKCYSVMCPAGEVGDIHISSIDRTISQDEFVRALVRGWDKE